MFKKEENTNYKPIIFIELKKMNNKDLFFKLRQNMGNLKGMKEYLVRFYIKKNNTEKNNNEKNGNEKNNNEKNNSINEFKKDEFKKMINCTNENLENMMKEVERRIKNNKKK
jgi:hypothetical protein